MGGIPAGLDIERFVGATLVQICLSEYQVQLHFQPSDDSADPQVLELGIEGDWELRDDSGAVIDRSAPNSAREAYRLHILLGVSVASSELNPPESLGLRFTSGHKLSVFGGPGPEESFSIQPGDVFV